jgi:hypothetical protein
MRRVQVDRPAMSTVEADEVLVLGLNWKRSWEHALCVRYTYGVRSITCQIRPICCERASSAQRAGKRSFLGSTRTVRGICCERAASSSASGVGQVTENVRHQIWSKELIFYAGQPSYLLTLTRSREFLCFRGSQGRIGGGRNWCPTHPPVLETLPLQVLGCAFFLFRLAGDTCLPAEPTCCCCPLASFLCSVTDTAARASLWIADCSWDRLVLDRPRIALSSFLSSSRLIGLCISRPRTPQETRSVLRHALLILCSIVSSPL